jgi:hypothetical protein
MTTAATSLLGLALPVTGELSGTWGDTVNNGITSLVDSAIAGTTTLSSDTDVTLTTTTLSANQAREAIILWTAGGTATRTITAPAQSKTYVVINKTSSTQSIKLVGVGPTTGVTVVAGTSALVAWNGLDFVTVAVFASTGILPVANGGTGVTTSTGSGSVVLSTSPTISLPVIDNIKMGYTTTATAAGTTTLTASSNYRQFFTGSTTQTVVLPVTSTLVTGIAYEIENNSTGLLTVNSSGGNLVGTVPAGVCAHAVCIGTTLTTAADWDWDYISNTSITGTGSAVLGTSPTINNPTVTNYVESVVAIGNSGTTQTLSLTSGTVQTVTMTGNCTFTMPTATAGKSFILICTQDATGSRTAVFTSVKWPGGTAPTLTTTATTGVDILTFVANGTSWFGTYAQAFA